MCLRAMSGGVRGARWTQIGAIARANMPCRPLEWRLPCQMNCRKGGQKPCTAVCGSSASFRQIIARADVPWRHLEWRLPCQMNCRKARERAQMNCRNERPGTDELQKSAGPRPDDLPESESPGSAPAATLSQCSVATRVCLTRNIDFQLPRRYN